MIINVASYGRIYLSMEMGLGRLHKMKGKSTNKKFKGEEGERLGKGL